MIQQLLDDCDGGSAQARSHVDAWMLPRPADGFVT